MTEEKTHPNKQSIEEFLEAFRMASERKRLGLLSVLEERVDELLGLGTSLMSGFDPGVCDWTPGFILQLIHKTDKDFIRNTLNCDNLSWFDSPSDVGFDYSPLQRFLLNESYEDADRFTSSKLRELAGEKAVKRGYVYFSEVESIPAIDLSTLDKLWVVYSRGKFGFTVQAKILDSLGGRYDKLLSTLGGKDLPATGFGFGDMVIMELLKDKGLLPQLLSGVEDVVIALEPELKNVAVKVASVLRDSDRLVDLVLENKKMKWAFKHAERVGANRIILVAPEEWSRQKIKVKDLQSGEEFETTLEEI